MLLVVSDTHTVLPLEYRYTFILWLNNNLVEKKIDNSAPSQPNVNNILIRLLFVK